MNQILVTEKLYITPEFKRKRMLYKIEFFLSVFWCLLYFLIMFMQSMIEIKMKSITRNIKSDCCNECNRHNNKTARR